MDLRILYRGPLASCNYGCAYCPFAKHAETAAELAADRQALARFSAWVAARPPADRLGILFTPWGEALIRSWYQDALIFLSNLPQVERVAIQTNLSARLGWLPRCDRAKLALWTTWHPTEVSRARFRARCQQLDRLGVRYSVGVVGLREHAAEIAALRAELPAQVYLWINASKRQADYYQEEDLRRLEEIDPLFRVNAVHHASQGKPCRAGSSVVTVDGDGTLRRCHFIKEPLGNIYAPGWEAALQERLCSNATCGCHIGYVHLQELGLYDVFGAGVLERIPTTVPPARRG